jgi:hypothetical protein
MRLANCLRSDLDKPLVRAATFAVTVSLIDGARQLMRARRELNGSSFSRARDAAPGLLAVDTRDAEVGEDLRHHVFR